MNNFAKWNGSSIEVLVLVEIEIVCASVGTMILNYEENKMKKSIVILLLLAVVHSSAYSQIGGVPKNTFPQKADTSQFEFNSVFPKQLKKANGSLSDIQNSADWTDQADALLMFIFLYAINPILAVEIDGKLKWGWTKEVSLGFGKLGQYRTSVEYSWIDFEKNQNIFRAGLKYDILLKNKINYKEDPVESSVLTIGGGYFTDFDKYGYFPELSYGYSFRDAKYLMYPSLKLRYTFMSEGDDVMDFSFGLVFGFANPFIHYGKPVSKKHK